MTASIKNLYNTSLPSTRLGAFYNAFAYPTKISPEAIALYIAVHTKPNDTVLDVFGGSGSTAIAALLCEHPTESMIALADKIGANPEWGARNAIIYEVGTYGAFAVQVMANPPKRAEFLEAVESLLGSAKEAVSELYSVVDPDGNIGTIRHIIHSDVVICPKCKKELLYFGGMVNHEPLVIDGNGICPHCKFTDASSNFKHATEVVFDALLGVEVVRRKRVPARIYGQTGRKKWMRNASVQDIEHINRIEALDYPSYCKTNNLVWGELHRAGYHTGISHLHHFYTKRNFLVMSYLWEKSASFPELICNALRLLLLSYNSSHSTLMTRVVVKKNSKDFVLTGAQSGVLYISSLPVEKNILTGIQRKQKNFADVFDFLDKCEGQIEVHNNSSRQLLQESESVDYIFTDPPFGDFIPYAEVNQINELWLGKTTNRAEEVIISASQNKGVSEYQEMLTDVFGEMKRVLKKSSYATVVFHSSKASVWNALCSAYTSTGFAVDETTSLDKSQASFKQVVSNGSVQGDPLILLSKGNGSVSGRSSLTVLDEVISAEPAKANDCARKIYSNYIGECLKQGITVDYDAGTAYAYVAKKAGSVV
jgi:16S rRNA G966 N2-methylase RsmD